MYHCVLIHGACMGAWSWYKLSDRLEKLGHKVTAMDMGASGGNPKETRDIKTIEDYNYPLTEFMESLPSGEKVTLVGHSLGGLNISHAMNLFPDKISVAVFQSAFMPTSPMVLSQTLKEADEHIVDWLDTEFGYSESNEIKYFKFGKEFVEKRLCQNSSTEERGIWDVCRGCRRVRTWILHFILFTRRDLECGGRVWCNLFLGTCHRRRSSLVCEKVLCMLNCQLRMNEGGRNHWLESATRSM